MYSLKEAAEATGRGKPAILKAIQKGRISGKKNELGEWEIDPAELHRVYPPVSRKPVPYAESERQETQETGMGNSLLERDIQHKDETIRLLEQQIALLERVNGDLMNDRDHWRKQAQQATALLTHQKEQEPAKTPEATATPSPLWQKLFGRKTL